MLGLIFRTVIGRGPSQFQNFFEVVTAPNGCNTRSGSRRHKLHLQPFDMRLDCARHSALGLIEAFNMRPPDVISSCTISNFQSRLQAMARHAALTGMPNWDRLFVVRAGIAGRHIRFVVGRP